MSFEFADAVVLCLKRNKRLGIKPSSQTEIAEHFGLSKPYVNQLINGNVANTANTRHWIEEIKKYVEIDE
ncbi:XRE family transcriptional regulator [Liquorilactobacillus sicerae]|uniref:XRE family transcriptional regulator n=1 Tax=Liquorilactobacillus sicerae TaxID=1416943 RepID=UPI002480A442|nr:XRE family transcriptional regulator [Liquorilactobacillus sicerae]